MIATAGVEKADKGSHEAAAVSDSVTDADSKDKARLGGGGFPDYQANSEMPVPQGASPVCGRLEAWPAGPPYPAPASSPWALVEVIWK